MLEINSHTVANSKSDRNSNRPRKKSLQLLCHVAMHFVNVNAKCGQIYFCVFSSSNKTHLRIPKCSLCVSWGQLNSKNGNFLSYSFIFQKNIPVKLLVVTSLRSFNVFRFHLLTWNLQFVSLSTSALIF